MLYSALIYVILLCYSIWIRRQKERSRMEVHDIADLAGRIGRGLMEQVFKTCRVAIVFDWDKFSSKNTDAFQAALGSLSEDKLDALDAVFTPAKRLYSESKNKLTILSYLEQNGLLPMEDDSDEQKARKKAFDKIKNKTSALAVWCVLNLDSEDIRELTDMVIIDAKSGNKWKTFEMEFTASPGHDVVKEHEQELANNLRSFVNQKEKCADFSHPLAYRVGSRQAFLLKMNDQTVELEEAKKDSSFEWVQFNPSVKLVVTLDDESNRICVHYRNGTHAKTITERFCNVLFGEGGYKIAGEVHYDLSQFITNPKSNLGSDSKNIVRNVSVVGLDVLLRGSSTSQRSYRETSIAQGAIGLYEAIYNDQHPDDDELSGVEADKLTTLFPKGTIARRVRLRAWFDTATRRNRSKTFEISGDSEHGFQDVPRHICDAMRRFLEENQITKKEPADGDT